QLPFSSWPAPHRAPHSFPTRRSSDLHPAIDEHRTGAALAAVAYFRMVDHAPHAGGGKGQGIPLAAVGLGVAAVVGRAAHGGVAAGGRAHVCTQVTSVHRMPVSAGSEV